MIFLENKFFGGYIMVQKRDIAMTIILSVITCGIYGIYWFVMLNDEINTVTGDSEAPTGGVAFLLTLVTCGIYGYYWMYKMGEKLDRHYISQGMPNGSRGILYLILSFFGLGIISYALMQDSLNKLVY